MLKPFRTIDDVLDSAWAHAQPREKGPPPSDRVFKSTRLEDSIYAELRKDDAALDELEIAAAAKLKTFSALSRDVYQSFYSLQARRVEDERLSPTARKFNTRILEHVMEGEDYLTIKSICEGRDLLSYEASAEFLTHVSEDLDQLLSDAGGEKGALNTLEKLEVAKMQAQQNLSDLLERRASLPEKNGLLDQKAVEAANEVDSKTRQAEAVAKLADTSLAKNKTSISAMLADAAHAAKDKAEEVQSILGAWSDDSANMGRHAINIKLLKQVRKSPALMQISKYLGRFREIFAQAKKNGYAYGCGEKYALELGRDLTRAITSELAMLATPETLPLFLRKYQTGQIKQYQRREPVYKGMGDVIVCLDESDSTEGSPAAWGKAVAMTLLELAADSGRRFALIHFSGSGSAQTDLFLPGAYTANDKLIAAETFLGGGTDFVTPMQESLRLMTEQGFETADIVFLTDGICEMPQDFAHKLRAEQAQRRFTITGILLDADAPGMEFSLQSFCQNIYRTSELTGESILSELVQRRVS